MANIRFSDKPQLLALLGTEVIPAQALDGGTDTDSNPVAEGSDICISVDQLLALFLAKRSAVTTISHSAAGALDLDYALGDYFVVTLGANVSAVTISNPPASGFGGAIRVRFIQDATGGRTVAIPSSFKAINGTDTAIQTAANAQTILHLATDDAGTSWDYAMKAVAA